MAPKIISCLQPTAAPAMALLDSSTHYFMSALVFITRHSKTNHYRTVLDFTTFPVKTRHHGPRLQHLSTRVITFLDSKTNHNNSYQLTTKLGFKTTQNITPLAFTTSHPCPMRLSTPILFHSRLHHNFISVHVSTSMHFDSRLHLIINISGQYLYRLVIYLI